MTTAPKRISTAASVAGLSLAAVCLFFTVFMSNWLTHQGGGDPAGDALARGITDIALLLFCLLLGALVLTAVLCGAMPPAGRLAIWLLTLAAFVAIFKASDLLAKPGATSGLWPLIIPAAAPTLIIAYCVWALLPPLQARVPARVAGFGLLGALGLVSAAILPLEAMRTHESGVWAAQVADWEAKLAAMPEDADLSRWIPFLNSGVYSVEEAARGRIGTLPSRQRDAEAMLARDAFPLRELSRFDLDPTPALCQNAQGSLSRRAAALALKPGDKPEFDRIANEVFAASGAIQWLVSRGCASDAASRQWEAVARSYGASDIQVSDLVAARDPGKLGSTLPSADGR